MVDSMPVEIAKPWRARFKKMRRLRKALREDKQDLQSESRKPESYEGTVYGVIPMVVVEASSGKVVDIRFHPASLDKGFQEPIPQGVAQREDLITDGGFDGPEVMTAGRGKRDASQRQHVESVLSVAGNPLRLPWKEDITAPGFSKG